MRKGGVLAIAGLALTALCGTRNAAAADEKKDPHALKAVYNNGFNLTTADKKFELRITAAIQYRYTYMDYDHKIKGNEQNYSNFFLRRARLWLDGNALDPRLTYHFHFQFEPQAAVNTHEAWIQYKFSDLFALRAGRDKIPYGTEFLASGFGLNFIDRSIMNGETDIDKGNGYSKWPGGNQAFGTSAEQANNGFPIGGMNLFRSQGLLATGMTTAKGGSAFQYEVGAWDGRDSRGNSNSGDRFLYSARLGYYPLGYVNTLTEGDVDYTENFKVGILASAYTGDALHNKDAAGATVPTYTRQRPGVQPVGPDQVPGLSPPTSSGTPRPTTSTAPSAARRRSTARGGAPRSATSSCRPVSSSSPASLRCSASRTRPRRPSRTPASASSRSRSATGTSTPSRRTSTRSPPGSISTSSSTRTSSSSTSRA